MANLKAQITDGKDESTKRASEAEILQLTADIYSLKVRIALSVARAAVLQLVATTSIFVTKMKVFMWEGGAHWALM